MDERLKQLLVRLGDLRQQIDELAAGEYDARSTSDLYFHIHVAAKEVLDAQKCIALARIYA